MLKFTKKEREIVIENDNIFVYEDDIEIIQNKREYIVIDDDIKRIKNYIKNRNLKIYLEEDIFIYKEIISKEKSEYTDINSYIKTAVKKILPEDKGEYEIFYFYNSNEEYEVFVIEERIIKNLIEVMVKEELKIDKIFISKEKKFEINDYSQVLNYTQKNNSNIKFYVLAGIIILLSSLVINSFINKENDKLKTLKFKISAEDKNLNESKIKLEKIKEENMLFEKENKIESRENKKFKDEILWIIKALPHEMQLKSIYWEKNNLILDGSIKNINTFFIYISMLEKEKKIKNLTYDYILNNQGIYSYVLEIKVS